ncbi:hypothetical protein ACG-M12_0077 [Escherichia phage vB_EcoS_ACG-M12]|uniref:Uncharacterized protein n=2 Tax=Guelphvirus TaxID=2732062 RepID=K4FBV3_9CAUD|nr:hypothetical protein D861_gp01 [Escherichia phage vB_EcoS_ACG-M12]AFH19959.1 hypothetical protein ACG-M12_0077 [Escherichia phage vB_EcoS_ACG-M12]UOX39753.1 hypothetical protein [Escherichia phage vB_EcoS_SCS31]
MIPRNVRKRYLTHQSAERVLLLGCRAGSKIPSCSEYVEEMSITKKTQKVTK